MTVNELGPSMDREVPVSADAPPREAAVAAWIAPGARVEWTGPHGEPGRGVVDRLGRGRVTVFGDDGRRRTLALADTMPAQLTDRQRVFANYMAATALRGYARAR